MTACIVTGAAAGNGQAIARALRDRSYHVVGVDRSPVPEGVASETVVGSVLDEGVMLAAFDAALRNSAGPLHLINNAGVTSPEYPQSDSAWDNTIDVNLAAPFRWSRHYAEHVELAGSARGASYS